MAASSVTELVQAVKRPRALSESINYPLFRKSGGDREDGGTETLGRRKSESAAPIRQNLNGVTRSSMQPINELPEKKQGKSSRRSFMR